MQLLKELVSILSRLLAVVPHAPRQTQPVQVAGILQEDSFNKRSCVICLLDKLVFETTFSKHSCLIKMTHAG